MRGLEGAVNANKKGGGVGHLVRTILIAAISASFAFAGTATAAHAYTTSAAVSGDVPTSGTFYYGNARTHTDSAGIRLTSYYYPTDCGAGDMVQRLKAQPWSSAATTGVAYVPGVQGGSTGYVNAGSSALPPQTFYMATTFNAPSCVLTRNPWLATLWW